MLHQTKGRITHDNGAAINALKKRALEWDVPLTEEASGFCFHIWDSKATLTPDETGVSIEILVTRTAASADPAGQPDRTFRGMPALPKWEEVAEGALAPGMSLMQVASITPRSAGFTRVRLQGHDAARFGIGSYHFRLLLPRRGRPPCWPRIAASGRTAWPEGDDALHKPVYTTVACGEDWLEFDIFRHEGSPTSRWAEDEPVGRTVGLIGPGGGACPESRDILLFGDETAIPAIIRMLRDAPGKVYAFVQAKRHDLCELADDARVTQVENLVNTLKATVPAEGAYVWFAGHAEMARAARAHLTDLGLPKNSFTAAAYWS